MIIIYKLSKQLHVRNNYVCDGDASNYDVIHIVNN